MKKPRSGRGAISNPKNPFEKNHLVLDHWDSIDELPDEDAKTEIHSDYPKTIVNKIDSPDLGMFYSLNPYKGCEHGCSYCYARNAHFYWGMSAGKDFETKIVVKKNAAAILKKTLEKKNWVVKPISLSGNTDCYQPTERKLGITRELLKVLQAYNHPVGIITKNALVLRDGDILAEMAKKKLVKVYLSINTLDEHLRRVMEPRTSSIRNRFDTIHRLSDLGIPTFIMCAPIIPGLNNHHLPGLLEKAAERGAAGASYTLVRLNGAVSLVFEEWIRANFPSRANKVLNQIRACHAGKLNDSRFGKRIRGKGPIAENIKQMFNVYRNKYFANRQSVELDLTIFKRPPSGQLRLF